MKFPPYWESKKFSLVILRNKCSVSAEFKVSKKKISLTPSHVDWEKEEPGKCRLCAANLLRQNDTEHLPPVSQLLFKTLEGFEDSKSSVMDGSGLLGKLERISGDHEDPT